MNLLKILGATLKNFGLLVDQSPGIGSRLI